jgi:hypothetical protein
MYAPRITAWYNGVAKHVAYQLLLFERALRVHVHAHLLIAICTR